MFLGLLVFAQFLVELWDIVVPLRLIEVSGHWVAKVIFCCYVIGFGTPSVVHGEPQLGVRVRDASLLLVH